MAPTPGAYLEILECLADIVALSRLRRQALICACKPINFLFRNPLQHSRTDSQKGTVLE